MATYSEEKCASEFDKAREAYNEALKAKDKEDTITTRHNLRIARLNMQIWQRRLDRAMIHGTARGR